MSPTERFTLACLAVAAATLVAAAAGTIVGWAIHTIQRRREIRRLEDWLNR